MRSQTLCLTILVASAFGDHWSDREVLIDLENSMMLGHDVVLTKKEQLVNKFLMNYKVLEYDRGFHNPRNFSPSRHFFTVREAIEESEVFQFIKRMPKGGALHGHDTALLSFDSLYNLTYEDHLHACTVNNRLKLRFLMNSTDNQECDWQLVKDLREQDASYDGWLRSQMTLVTENPREAYQDINEVWKALTAIFATITPFVTYRPVLEKYVYQALLELYEDNVTYLEFRGTLPKVYELDGHIYTPVQVAGIYKYVIDQFKKDHPNFIGARFIYAPSRNVNESRVADYVKIANRLELEYCHFLAGFDLVGQEDLGKPLSAFIPHFKDLSSTINIVFHAAETNWFGTSTDLNLVDAILLGTKRIGHGYGLIKHPILMNLARENQIAVEVCPISNQVLMLVEDLRNHPAAYLIANDYPIVVSYDDPSFWGTKGLSYDFYVAFMGIASRNSDLKLLKKLAENSLTYSTLPEKLKEEALETWREQWNDFIDITYKKMVRSIFNTLSK